jgi:hypothetical protein
VTGSHNLRVIVLGFFDQFRQGCGDARLVLLLLLCRLLPGPGALGWRLTRGLPNDDTGRE